MAQATSALLGLGIFTALVCLIYGPWQWVCTDYARQVLFEKRDEIFDLAAAGKLSFKSSEYRTIRRSLESSIRFAHDLTLPYFLLMLIARKDAIGEKSELLEAVERIQDDEVRKEVSKKVAEAKQTLVLMLGFKSPLVMLVFLPITLLCMGAIYFIDACRAHASTAIGSFGELIQVEAELAPSAVKMIKGSSPQIIR